MGHGRATGDGIDAGAPRPADRATVEVFPTGTTVAHRADPRPPTGPPAIPPVTAGDRWRHGRHAVRDGLHQAREFHARAGPRPGAPAPPVASGRQGGDADVVRPVLVDPFLACALAVSGELFAPPVPGLAIERSRRDDPDQQRYLVWEARLTTGRHRERRATLHLSASPSLAVTVLELVPRRRIGRDRQRFVDAGVAAVEVLAQRLERARRAAG